MDDSGDFPQRDWTASNDLAFAVRDPEPATDGHTLVIARRAVPDWFLLTLAERMALFDLVAVVKRALDEELAPDGYNVGFDSGAAAGQMLMRAHLHVLPRYAATMRDPGGMKRMASARIVSYGSALAARRAPPISVRERTSSVARAQDSFSRQWTVHGDGGEPLDATFRVESYETRLSVVIESGGGTRGSASARNSDYRAGLELVLARIAALGLLIVECLVDSSAVQHLSYNDRRLDLAYRNRPVDVANPV